MRDKILNFLGRSVIHNDWRFVPILGTFDFNSRELCFHDHAHALTQPECFEEQLDFEDWHSWWAKARLLKLFAIQPPVSCCLTHPLNFLLAAMPKDASHVDSIKPLLVTSWPQYASFGLRFLRHESQQSMQHLADAFFKLMLAEPHGLGVFSEYYVRLWDDSQINAPSTHEVALHRVSCDGAEFHLDFLGYLRPQDTTDDEIEEINAAALENCDMEWVRDIPVWPFEMPRKR